MNLSKLIVLFLDCQTTGSNPRKGDIIEIGWARSGLLDDDVDESGVDAYLLKLPSGQEIPARIRVITGVTQDELDDAHEPRTIWQRLMTTALEIARLNNLEKCPLIIHFARFETPFLYDLHGQHGDRQGFPFRVICTHTLAKRLFPELPRRSLRAMAGYFGYSLGQKRRCKEHVRATAIIWQEMVKLLEEQHGIKTLEQLQQWLDQPMVTIAPERVYPMSDTARSNLPDDPGVYRMLRSNGDVLYVGKAGSLCHRVNSYFRKSSRHPEHILEMLSQAKQLDVTVTESALEAAILESDEIKRLSPPYNIALRRDERDVWFCTPDLSEFSETLSKQYRVGPLVSRDAIERYAAIRRVVETDDVACTDDEDLMAALGMPEDYAPDIESIRSGFAIFLKKYRGRWASASPELTLNEISKELWLEQLAEKEAVVEEPEEFRLELMKVPIWTPESACHLIESSLVRGAYELRRARWLVLLSESSLAWEEVRRKQSARLLVVFEKGQVLFRRTGDHDALPIPPGYASSFMERQRSFDLMTADRMRVVTTEVRKAVASGRKVKLCVRPGLVLTNDKLMQMFRWV